jgi:hypothetical protein
MSFASETFVHAYQFFKVLLECNGVSISEVKHTYSEQQGCGFLYHKKISVIMFCPDVGDTTTFIRPEILDTRFQIVPSIIEQPKKKADVSFINLIDSVWKSFRVNYPHVQRWIIVSRDVSSFINTLLLETMWNRELSYTLQHFKYSEIGDPCILTRHKFQPRSIRIVQKAPTALSRQILVYDIVARFYGLCVGQVLECKGYQSQSAEQVDYLQVTFSHSIKGNKLKPSKLPENTRAAKKKPPQEEEEEVPEQDEPEPEEEDEEEEQEQEEESSSEEEEDIVEEEESSSEEEEESEESEESEEEDEDDDSEEDDEESGDE